MPSFDSGRCFLTTLLPIENTDVEDDDGARHSHVQLIRQVLAILPTAHQSPVTERLPCNSPFAKCTRTHFARFAVLDDVIFNGRTPTNAVLDPSDRTIPQKQDQLPTPYLMFVVDFDAPLGTEDELESYLENVWTNMSGDLEAVFRHCFGFSGKVKNARDFAGYIIACQVETTMPFNDYWPAGPIPLRSLSVGVLIAAGLAIAVAAAGIIHALGLGFALSIAAGIAAGICVAYAIVMVRGAKPFPMAPNSDLRSILKALYVQRQMIPFVTRMQGVSDKDLFDEFGKLLDIVRLDNLDAPTQAPGTIGN